MVEGQKLGKSVLVLFDEVLGLLLGLRLALLHGQDHPEVLGALGLAEGHEGFRQHRLGLLVIREDDDVPDGVLLLHLALSICLCLRGNALSGIQRLAHRQRAHDAKNGCRADPEPERQVEDGTPRQQKRNALENAHERDHQGDNHPQCWRGTCEACCPALLVDVSIVEAVQVLLQGFVGHMELGFASSERVSHAPAERNGKRPTARG
mmetsp:Transcript_90779/g.241218  ORF Transcript_90779/g.241218 Transcript_90779/m.241218 type:complete len:207 (-) Transcript_90779:47-667(-)